MKMAHNGMLEMPCNFSTMDEEELTYVDGGIGVEAVCAIVGAVIASTGLSYASGQVAGERLYYAGVTNKKIWAKYKWKVRALALVGGAVTGPVFVIGVENKLYSMM